MTQDMNANYRQVAWCTMLSPADESFFRDLKEHGVDAAIIPLRVTSPDMIDYHSLDQLQAARKAGMIVHVGLITNLSHPELDVTALKLQMELLHFKAGTQRIAIMPMADPAVSGQTDRLCRVITSLCSWCDIVDIDVCLKPQEIYDGIFDLGELPSEINLTIMNPTGRDAGVPTAGTWIYANRFMGELQFIAYDFYGYYTERPADRGYQLDLTGEYEAQVGDSWWVIAKKYDMALIDLLALNEADIDDRIMPGQIIKVN